MSEHPIWDQTVCNTIRCVVIKRATTIAPTSNTQRASCETLQTLVYLCRIPCSTPAPLQAIAVEQHHKNSPINVASGHSKSVSCCRRTCTHTKKKLVKEMFSTATVVLARHYPRRFRSCVGPLKTSYCKVTNFRTVFIFVHFVLLKKYEI